MGTIRDLVTEGQTGISTKLQKALDNYDYKSFYLGALSKIKSFNTEIIGEYYWEISKGAAKARDISAIVTLAASNKWKSNISLFVVLLENIKKSYDDGFPGRQYGAEAVSEILNEIDWDSDFAQELYEEIKESYYLENIDFEYTDYSMINKAANKKEADYIKSQGPLYRHD